MLGQERLLERFKSHGLLRGNTLLFPAAIAVEVILASSDAGCRILGIDGFVITATTTQPLMEHSIDFSGGPAACENTTQAALEFVKARQNLGLYFEVVI